MRRLVVLATIAVAAVAAAAVPAPEIAQAGPSQTNVPPPGSLRLQARGGFDGYGRIGGWIPVVADVFNESPTAFGGEIQVRVAHPNTGTFSTAPTVYTTPVAVAGRSHRRYTLDVRIPSTNNQVRATLVSAGEVVAEQDITLSRVSLGEMFCGVIGRDARNYDFLAAVDLPPPLRRARVVPLATAELPSTGHLLGSFDCLILDGANSSQLRPEQIEALQVWVNGGGLLFTVAGAGWRANLAALPHSLLPVEPRGLASVESLESLAQLAGAPLDEPGPWLVTRARLQPGAGAGRVLASEEGIPLVVAAKRGDGGVIYLAFDPASPALMSWPGQAALWRYLLGHVSVDSGIGSTLVRPYLRWGRVPRWALADYSTRPRPDATWLLWLTPVLAATSAFGVLALGRGRRPGQAAVALVGASLACGAAAFSLARVHAEPDLEVNHISIVRPVALGEAAYTRTYVAAWAKQEGAYSFQLPARALPFSMWYPSPRDGGQADAEWQVSVAQLESPRVHDLQTRSSTLNTFAFDGQIPASAARIEADLFLERGNQLRGSVRNPSDQRILDLALVVDGQVVPLGTLDPGRSVLVRTTLETRATAGYGGSQVLPTLIAGEAPRNEPPSGLRDAMDALFGQRFLTRRAELRGPTFIGWLERDLVELQVTDGGSAAVRGSALLLSPAGVRLPVGYAGPVPATLLTRRDLGGSPTFAPDLAHYTVAPGESVNLQFTLPMADGPWDVDDLLVNLEARTPITRQVLADPAAANSEAVPLDRVTLFNWRSGVWQEWELGGPTARIPDPQDFVSATGDIRVRYFLDPIQAAHLRQVQIGRLDVTPVIRVSDG